MTAVQKLYFSTLGFLSLLIIAITCYYGLNQTANWSNQPLATADNHLAETQAALTFLEQKLAELESENQQKITEIHELNTQDQLLSEQIRLKMDQLRDYYVKLGELSQAINTKTQELQQTSLTPDEKTVLTQTLADLKKQQTAIQTAKEQLNQETLALNAARKALYQKQTATATTLKHQQSMLLQVTQFKELEEEINDLTVAMAYNEAEKSKIHDLLSQAENDEVETAKLKNYQLFLEQQLLSFQRRIKKIRQEINAYQTHTPFIETKKLKTFQDIYEMKAEKEQFANIINYFNAPKHIIGYRNLKPMGILLYGPPGTGKSHLMEALSGEVKAHYMAVDPSRFEKTYVGEGNAELEQIWNEAEAYDKTIIFIDEISGLANREDKNANQTAKNIVNNLLLKLDGFKRSDKKIILMGGTNHLDQIDPALRSRFSKEIKIDAFKPEEIPGFLKWLILKNDYRLSYHALNYLEPLVKRALNYPAKTLTNRDWVQIISEAASNYDRFAFTHANHEVMLPSDLDEALDNCLGIKKTIAEIQEYRQTCENQYGEWKRGLLKYLELKPNHTLVHKTYTFFGLNGLDKCQYPDKVPKDLAPFIREPFDNWYYTAQMQPYRGIGSEVDYYSGAYFDINVSSNKDSVFRSLEGGYNNSFVRSNHTVEMEYEGPQFLLEQDQDFYVNEIECPLQQEQKWQEGKTALYYLHFNPKQQYITLYTEKMHTKNN